jgi:hypothetical protein
MRYFPVLKRGGGVATFTRGDQTLGTTSLSCQVVSPNTISNNVAKVTSLYEFADSLLVAHIDYYHILTL